MKIGINIITIIAHHGNNNFMVLKRGTSCSSFFLFIFHLLLHVLLDSTEQLEKSKNVIYKIIGGKNGNIKRIKEEWFRII